jgi:biopolymer transport protein ExbD
VHTGPGGDKYRLISEINMIPFIDVSLVLLIIFMVMTPFLMKSQIKVNLPGSQSAQQITQDDKTVDIQVQADGAIFLEGKKIAAGDLEKALSGKVHDPKNQAVMIEADKKAAFEHVVAVMGVVKKMGVTKMGVGVIEEKSSSSRGNRK